MGRKRKQKNQLKTAPKGTRQGSPLSDMEKEMLIQAYAVCGNQRAVARNMGVGVKTVYNVLKEARTNTQLQKARARAVEELAGKAHSKSLEMLESITPADMESGLIDIHDQHGNLVQRRQYGPSLLQKVTSVAIMVDKQAVLANMQRDLEDIGQTTSGIPLPGDVQGAIKRIGQQVKRLRILDVQFESKAPDTAQKVQDMALKADVDFENAEEAEFEIDLDNPK